MTGTGKSRVQFLLGLLIVIALIHVVAIYFIASGGKGGRTSEEKSSAAEAKGNDNSGSIASEKKEEISYLYRKVSTLKNFGAPLDYSGVRRGNLKEIPLTRQARAGILVDMDTRKVLWAKNEAQPRPIASMTKMMTMLLALEEADRRKLPLETVVTASAAASRVPPSGIGLKKGEKISLLDLMKSAMIRSANDAAYQIAEYFSDGKVDNFVRRMNERAKELGLKGVDFRSPHGLPSKPDSSGTAESMIFLAERLQEYPVCMKWVSTSGTYIRNGKTLITNTNHLIRPRYPGVNGMKTGYTRNAGYCVTVSCERNGRRLMLCLMGLNGAKAERDPLARKLLDWGYKKISGRS